MASSLGGIPLTEKRINEIVSVARDWCLYNGVGLRSSGQGPDFSKVVSAPFTLFPSVIPSSLMNTAKETMPHFNRLMHKVALDHDFLEETFKSVIKVDDFMHSLWDIYLKVRETGVKQPIMLGLFRNDFMINCNRNNMRGCDISSSTSNCLQIRQIEFNTIAAGMPGLTMRMVDLHRLTLGMAGRKYTSNEVPSNTAAAQFGAGMVRAWELYGNPNAVIVFLVASYEKNVQDQRALEFEVYRINPLIRVLRKTLVDIYEFGALDNDSNLIVDEDEVAVLYLREGYTAANYPSQKEWDARLKMELSRAIKCPSIQYQLVGAKKIQLELAKPGALERFVDDPGVVEALRATFAGFHSLDMGIEGDQAVNSALKYPEKFVLKPQREGGGHNLYGEDIVMFLNNNGNSTERNAYILMERIYPLRQKNYLYKEGASLPLPLVEVVGELGIFGLYIGTTGMKEYENKECDYLLRSKAVGITEGGICVGSSALDTVFIV